MSNINLHSTSADKSAILYETWKSVHELKAGLKRTEDKIAGFKSVKIDTLISSYERASSGLASHFNRLQENGTEATNSDTDISSIKSSTKIRILNDYTSQPKATISPDLSDISSVTLDSLSFNGHFYESSESDIVIHRPKINPYFVEKTKLDNNTTSSQFGKLKRLVERQALNHFSNSTYGDEPPKNKVLSNNEDTTPASIQYVGRIKAAPVRKMASTNSSMSHDKYTISKKSPPKNENKKWAKKLVTVRKIATKTIKTNSIVTPSSWRADIEKTQPTRKMVNTSCDADVTQADDKVPINNNNMKKVSITEPLINNSTQNGATSETTKSATQVNISGLATKYNFDLELFDDEKTNKDDVIKPQVPTAKDVRKTRRPKSKIKDEQKENKKVKNMPKVIHYDPEIVRKYMNKKKTERLMKHREQQQAKTTNEEIKKRRLKALYEQQKKSVESCVKRQPHVSPVERLQSDEKIPEAISKDQSSNPDLSDHSVSLSSLPENNSKLEAVQALAISIQNKIDEETKRIQDFKFNIKNNSTNHMPKLFDLPAVTNFLTPLGDWQLKNTAATKIQTSWRDYQRRKSLINAKNITQEEDKLSEGFLSSDDAETLQGRSLSPMSSHSAPDPHNFINSIARKNLVFERFVPPTVEKIASNVYEPDFESSKSSSKCEEISSVSSITEECADTTSLEPSVSLGPLSSVDLSETEKSFGSVTSNSRQVDNEEVANSASASSVTMVMPGTSSKQSTFESSSSTLKTSTDFEENRIEEMTICSTKLSDPSNSVSRLSPSGLHRRMQIELNQLNAADASLRKVHDIQQMNLLTQTPSVQMLQRNELKQQQEMHEMLMKMTEERCKAEQRLEMQLKQHENTLKSVADRLASERTEAQPLRQSLTERVLDNQALATQKLVEVLEVIKIHQEKVRNSSISSTSSASVIQEKSSVVIKESSTDVISEQVTSAVDSNHNKPTSSCSVSSVQEAISNNAQSSHQSTIHEQIASDAESAKYSTTFHESLSEDEIKTESRHSLNQSSSLSSVSEISSISHKSSSPIDVKSQAKSSMKAESHTFDKFTMNMVKQYMKEGELRAHHQRALLKLREKAIVDKTKAEIALLEIKKRSVKEQGSENEMRVLRKKQRGLLLRLQQEQAEMKRLKGAHRTAQQQRHMLYQQHEDIYKLQQSTKHIMSQIKLASLTNGKHLKSLSQLSLASSIRTSRSKLTKTTSSNSTCTLASSLSSSNIETAQDSTFTGTEVSAEEVETLQSNSTNNVHGRSKTKESVLTSTQNASTSTEIHTEKEPTKESRNMSTESVSEYIHDSMDDRKVVDSNASIQENISSHSNLRSESEIKTKSGEEPSNYSDSFESDSKMSTTPKSSKLVTRSPLSPRSISFRHRQDSSGSEESYSMSLSETDHSDIEARIIALKGELKKRKAQADRLKRQQKRANQERLRAEEDTLKKQLEAYDRFIQQATNDLQKELDSDVQQLHKSAVKPQIKQESRRLRKQNEIGSLSQSSFEASSPPITSSEKSPFSKPDLSTKDTKSASPIREQSESSIATEKSITDSSQKSTEHVSSALEKSASSAPESITEAPMRSYKSASSIPEQSESLIATEKSIADSSQKSTESVSSALEKSGSSIITEKSITDLTQKSTESVNSALEKSAPSVSTDNSIDELPPRSSESASYILEKSASSVSSDSSTDSPLKDTESVSSIPEKFASFVPSEGSIIESESSVDEPVEAQEVALDETFVIEPKTAAREAQATIKVLEALADKITADLMSEILIEASLLYRTLAQVPADSDWSQSTANKITDELMETATADAYSDIFSISNLKKLKSPSKSAVAQRVDTIMSERLESPQWDKYRPQDLMVLSSLLADDSDELISSENFPFTDTFRGEHQNAAPDVWAPKESFSDDLFIHQEWIDDAFGLSMTDASNQSEDPAYPLGYYRQIPNKPPPPYIPPESGPYSMPTASSGSQTVQYDMSRSIGEEAAIYVVPHTEHEVSKIIKDALDDIYPAYVDGIQFSAMTPTKDVLFEEWDFGFDFQSKSRFAYKNLIFDLVKQAAAAILSVSKSNSSSTWKKSFRQFCSSEVPTPSRLQLEEQVIHEIFKVLQFTKQPSRKPTSGSGWNTILFLGQHRRDYIDNVLVDELFEEEDEWLCYDEDEKLVKENIVESILDDAVCDTFNSFLAIDDHNNFTDFLTNILQSQ